MNVAESAAKKNECIHSNDKKFELDLDLIENGEMSEEQIQTLWDTTFTTNSDASVQGLPSAWIKRPLSQDKVPHLNYSILPATNPPSPIRIAGSGYNSRVERNDKKNKSLHEIGPPVVLPNIEQKSYGQHNTDFRSFPHSLKSFYSTETKKLSKSGQVLDKSRDPLITRKKAIQKTDIDQVNQLMNRIASSTAVKASTARQLVRNIQKSYSTTAMTKTNV